MTIAKVTAVGALTLAEGDPTQVKLTQAGVLVLACGDTSSAAPAARLTLAGVLVLLDDDVVMTRAYAYIV